MNAIFRLPIKIKEKKEEKIMWTRKKLYILYLCWMPMIALAFAYFAVRPAGDTIGIIAENIGAIALFGILYSYLRNILDKKKEIMYPIQVNLKKER
jgi:hypothetical protein